MADPTLTVLVGLAGAAAALLVGAALAAYVRRRSRPYLLIVLALSALLARAGIAGLSMADALAGPTHHLLEHGLDVAMAALVVAAVYYARSVEPDRPEVRS